MSYKKATTLGILLRPFPSTNTLDWPVFVWKVAIDEKVVPRSMPNTGGGGASPLFWAK